MPAGITDAPWAVPLKFLVVKLGFCKPEYEIGLVFLVAVLFNTFTNAYCKVFFLEIIENVVLL